MLKNNDEIFESYGLDLETLIPVGRENARSRKELVSLTGVSDRMIRRAIEESSLPIINNGSGYFIPDLEDPRDITELRAYINQETRRMASIAEKIEVKFAGLEERGFAHDDAHDHTEEYEQLELPF